MCLGVPGRIVDVHDREVGGMAAGTVEFDGLCRTVCLELVPEAIVGDYVVVHAGIAISRVDVEEAERLLNHLRALNEVEIPGDTTP